MVKDWVIVILVAWLITLSLTIISQETTINENRKCIESLISINKATTTELGKTIESMSKLTTIVERIANVQDSTQKR